MFLVVKGLFCENKHCQSLFLFINFSSFFESFWERMNILSLPPFPSLTHPVFSIRSKSFGFRLTISETLNPEE